MKSITLNEVKENIAEWLYIEDLTYIDVMAAFWIAHQIPGDPVWLLVVGPSGDTKTEGIELIRGKNCHYTDIITDKTLISGAYPAIRDVEKRTKMGLDLAPRLRDKIWIISDFSTILKMKQETRNQLFTQLRRLYDGRVTKSTGGGLTMTYGGGTKGNPKIYCSIIGGTTSALDSFLVEQQLLGSRHISYRRGTTDRKKMMEAIDDQRKDLDLYRERDNKLMRQYLENVKIDKKLKVPREVLPDLHEYADFTCKMRTGVEVDWYTGEVISPAEPEMPTRIYSQYRKMYKALLHIPDFNETAALEIIRKIALSSIPGRRSQVFQFMLSDSESWDEKIVKKTYSVNEISRILRIGYKAVKTELNVLWNLGMVEFHPGDDLADKGYFITEEKKHYNTIYTKHPYTHIKY